MTSNQNIEIKSILKTTSLKHILNLFSRFAECAVTLLDNKGKPITSTETQCEICNLIKNTEQEDYCTKLENEAIKKARESGDYQLIRCHPGIGQILIPLFYEGNYMGILISGKILIKIDGLETNEYTKHLEVPEEMKEQINKVIHHSVLYTEEKIKAAAELLLVVFTQICEKEIKNAELKEMNKRKIHGKREIIAKAKKFIQENFIKDIKLADAAREVALSNYYFSHLFKRETSTSFIEYLTQVRIEKAKELLSTTEMEVINIAFYVGYNDANYFSHVFRKATGFSPKDFRQQLKITS
ncbi:MAG: PocR ligand-binding domain-containing protein [Spirochaetales bacterium]|nr:PocR ligand-binding domain-containing protein [Spirochaetales bacterium]